MIQLDYTLTSIDDRKALVEQILQENPNPSEEYLSYLADYLVLCMDKQEKRDRKILTDNRLVTINKRETSYEGLSEKFENGEDGIYNILDNNKHAIFQKKTRITEEDVERMPELKQTLDAIKYWEGVVATAEGKNKYMAKKALIDFRKEQYSIKASNCPTWRSAHGSTQVTTRPELEGKEWIDADGNVAYSGVSLCDPRVCSAILCDYQDLKASAASHLENSTWVLIESFDKVRKQALLKYPLLDKIVDCKIANMQNIEIQQVLQDTFGMTHSLEYISSLWRKKIPNLIASAAEDNFLDWHYMNIEKGKWKKCSRCGTVKLAHNKYFSKNSTSKDGFYSICKCCRNKKKSVEEEQWAVAPLDEKAQ